MKPTSETPRSPPKTLDWKALLIGSGVILLATLAVYWPAVHAGFIWDDDDVLTANPLISVPDGLRLIWAGGKFYDYWPLTLTSFWFEWRLWGANATGYHVTNILLHAATAILFWRVLKCLKAPAAWLAALLFVIHPINVQSVAWITERKNTLSLFFAAVSLLAYLRSEECRGSSVEGRWHKGEARHAPRHWPWYWFSLVAFLSALLSKTSVVMLPFVLLLCTWWMRRATRPAASNQQQAARDRKQKSAGSRIRDHAPRMDPESLRGTHQSLLHTVPFFALSLVFGLITIWFQYQRSIGGEVVTTHSFPARFVGAGMAVWFYLAKILFPRHPTFVYPRWSFFPGDVANYLPGVLALAVCLLFWLNRNRWGGPFFFAWSCFLAMLFPVLGFFKIYFQKYSFVADHWVYPAMLPILALAVGGGAWVVRRVREPQLARVAGGLTAFAVVAVLAPLTWAQCGIYKDEETLWRATLKRNSACWLAHHNLASLLVTQWKNEMSSSTGVGDGRALSQGREGKLQEALSHELQAMTWKPDHAAAHYGAAYTLSLLNRIEEAIPHYRRAIELRPDLLPAIDSLAWILATHENPRLRNGAEALSLAKSAVALTGENDPKTLGTLAAASAEAGDFPAAIQAAQKALRLATDSGQADLAREVADQLRLFQSGRPLRSR